jgi:hypothetical protein
MALAGRKNEQDGRILGWWLVTRIEMDAVPCKIWLWGRINPWPSVDHATEPSRHLVQSRGKAPEPALKTNPPNGSCSGLWLDVPLFWVPLPFSPIHSPQLG